MGKTLIADVPGYRDQVSYSMPTLASTYPSSSIGPIHAVGRSATFAAACWTPSVDQSAAGSTNYRTLQILNRGVDGESTIVLASKILSASAGRVCNSLTLGPAENLALSGGEIIAFRLLIAGSGAATTGGLLQIEYT